MDLEKARKNYWYTKGVLNRAFMLMKKGPELDLLEGIMWPALEEYRTLAKAAAATGDILAKGIEKQPYQIKS